jgi:hypothetical protein
MQHKLFMGIILVFELIFFFIGLYIKDIGLACFGAFMLGQFFSNKFDREDDMIT